jgi:D-sedoheptulose 7-phosphate isomerase
MSIASRVTEFSYLLQQSEVTNVDGTQIGLEDGIGAFWQLLTDLREANGNLYIVGNGGSASVASHAVTDFMNVAKLKASTLHESSLLTCMSNDYQYENAYSRIISMMVEPNDVVIAISSSGRSLNIRNAASEATEKGARVVTFSGFDADTPLRSMGVLNFWIESRDYGFVELGHQFLLHNTSDRFKEF